MTTQLQATSQAAQPHVLAVDDDATIRQLIVDYLGQNELRVTAVPDGRSMQAMLAEQVVDLIVLDLKLQVRGRHGARARAARRVHHPDHHAHRPASTRPTA